MASILMGVITAILIILICGFVFYVGYRIGYANQPQTEQNVKAENERNKEIMEGFANIVNYANRHKSGVNKR